ncbi:unnamed protein product, partial [Bubo scandiacus]
MLLLTRGEAWALGALAMALLEGTWVADVGVACGDGSSQGTRGFLENEQYFWMTGHSAVMGSSEKNHSYKYPDIIIWIHISLVIMK